MKRLTLPEIRRRAWKILKHPKTVIVLKQLKKASAYGQEEEGIEIIIDPLQVNIRHATIHEILHAVLDPHFQQFATYELYEYWVASLETPFFESMSVKTRNKWYNAIAKKMPKKYRPTPKEGE